MDSRRGVAAIGSCGEGSFGLDMRGGVGEMTRISVAEESVGSVWGGGEAREGVAAVVITWPVGGGLSLSISMTSAAGGLFTRLFLSLGAGALFWSMPRLPTEGFAPNLREIVITMREHKVYHSRVNVPGSK